MSWLRRTQWIKKQEAAAGQRQPLLGRKAAAVLSIALVAAVLAPLRENWHKQPQDNFPFSYYPMFTAKRSATYKVVYLVGVDAQGQERNLTYQLAGVGGFNQIRRQIDKTVRQGRAGALCKTVAAELTRRGTDRRVVPDEVKIIHVVSGHFRFEDYFSGRKAPATAEIQASCPVVGGEI